MYYQNYEDYIRNILGYPIKQNLNINREFYSDTYNYSNNIPKYSSEILNLYPEIYKIINPMVCKICEANSKPITEELLEQMTDEIYLNIEGDMNISDDIINVRVNIPKNSEKNISSQNIIKETKNTYNRNMTQNNNPNILKQNTKNSDNENIINSEKRQVRRNNTLRDLIKILILNQLLLNGLRPYRQRPMYYFGTGFTN